MKNHLILAVALATGGVVQAQSIGINFISNRDLAAALGPAEVAGVPEVAQANWNNTNGGAAQIDGATGTEANIVSPSAGVLVDDSGVATAVTVSWASNGTWNTTNGSATPDAKLMNGYIDFVNATGFSMIDIAGIPYDYYDVYVYFGSDGNGRTGSVESGTAGREFFYTTASNTGAGFPAASYVRTEDEAGNYPNATYAVFENQTSADFSLHINRGNNNSGFHAVQIVSVPPPEDSDGDGLPDEWEIEHGLDPNDDGSVNPDNGAEGDPDGDGSPNSEELARLTDPQNPDTDDDGLLDGVETNTGVFVSASDTGTNPRNADTDRDGRLDGEEVHGSPATDPNNPDSDGDGISDGAEVAAGSDPNDPNSPIIAPPLAYWSFDDQSSPTADLSGNGNNATVNGLPQFVEGPSGESGDFAIQFDGLDDSVTTGVSLLSGLTSFTMAGWVKFDVAQPARTGFFGQNDAVEFGMLASTDLHSWTAVGGGFGTAFGPTAPWTHVAVTNNPSGRTIFVDGEAIATGPTSTGSTSTFGFNIGGGGIWDGTGNFFNGCIDEVAVWDVALSAGQIMQLANGELNPLGPSQSNRFRILAVNHDPAADTTELTWESAEGQLFDIRKSLDLTGDPADWTLVQSGVDAAPAPAESTTAVVDTNATEAAAFYKVFQVPPPPVFVDDFETDLGWTTAVNDANGNTMWQRGAPSNVGPPTGADGSATVFGTNLDSNYALNADIVLRSPEIDLTSPGITGANVAFDQWKEIEIDFDFGSIRVLRASDNVQLGADVANMIDGFTSDWEAFSAPLPSQAIGEVIRLEFQFTSDDFPDSNFAGWYIDNVSVNPR